MLDMVIDHSVFDAQLNALFSRVATRAIRHKAEIETLQGFEQGNGQFLFKFGTMAEKVFNVTGRPGVDHMTLVHTTVTGKNGKTLNLVFDAAHDAFTRDENPVSRQSTQQLCDFMRALN